MKLENCFTLWVHGDSDSFGKVPVLEFDDHDPSDDILEVMLKLDQLGITCSLTCQTWSVPENSI